jgi:iron-sulfur cluster protein
MTVPTFVGMPAFPDAARSALADTRLRENLGRATATIRDKRARAVAELPDWEALRHAGAAIKNDVLVRLPALLADLEANVTAAGGVVHWARDAAEANAIVAGIARTAGVTEVVKVKSMATQEIELNAALAEAGVDAWETDLAELIVQLGHDLPSHILVPAIHRNRHEIRDIFAREMAAVGRPAPDGLTADPAALAEAARLHLREKFLRAEMAVSGANFAVADTGTIVVVESEGNGRMCLTLPRILVTVMGIEKLVPTWSDLEVFLQLLPRSSTAERMNPYTSMWTGVTPGDGPQEFHLVLLDNGRTGTLADTVGRAALRCIRCSACLNVCPVYARTGGAAYGSAYPGPIGAILTPQLRGINQGPVDEQTASLPFASSLCGACYDVCPVEIDIPEILVRLRATVVEQRHGHIGERAAMAVAAATFATPGRLAAAQRVGGLLFGRFRRLRLRGPGWIGAWFGARDMTPPARESFRRWWAARSDSPSSSVADTVRPRNFTEVARSGSVRPRNFTEVAGSGGVRPRNFTEVARSGSDTGDARSVTMDRIRAALADAPAPVVVERAYGRSVAGDVVALFAERVAAYRASIEVVAVADLPDVIGRVLADHRIRRVAIPADLPLAWLGRADVEPVVDADRTPVRVFDGVDGVVTAAAVGIAVTGTIVLDAGAGQGRRAVSLLPDFHLCVIRAGQIVGTVPEAIARLDATRPQTWISGPSATSDIELNRVEGVHGPRTLYVLVVADRG